MKVFIAVATGATGKQLVRQLLQRCHQMVAVIWSTARVSENLRTNDRLQLIQASLLDLNEPVSTRQKIVVSIMRTLFPPQADNEKAADFLRTEIGQDDPTIEWAAVRPDSLVDETSVTEYTIYPSPIPSRSRRCAAPHA